MWGLHRKQAGVQGIAHAQTIRALSFDTDYRAMTELGTAKAAMAFSSLKSAQKRPRLPEVFRGAAVLDG